MAKPPTAVAVIGASGFVGSAVADALRARGAKVLSVTAPRLPASPEQEDLERARHRLEEHLQAVDVVVNAAGVGEATADDDARLMGANAALPSLLAAITSGLGIRLVHISSAAVQGRRPLDETMSTEAFSPYSRSKAEGERAVLAAGGRVVVYRPPGVHAPQRSITRALARLARSPLSSVAGAGENGSPQALAPNVADAVAYLATCQAEPPEIVMHPSEGVTTGSLLTDLGGRRPRRVPLPIARALVASVRAAAQRVPRLAGQARRLEVLWLGQPQGESWLTAQGWQPPVGREGWRALGAQLSTPHDEQGER